ncbi:MAG TPA: competence/damage-inducible protein A [Gemmatimonadales bacterium]|nr:competence/damage-inducible protein A [Gemmatimonadales bacterium]
MELELVTIGTELLLGFTLDTNGAEIGRALAAQGIRLARRTSVPDRADDIREAVAAALRRTGAVLTTGGLGPTSDDVTKQTVAGLFGTPVVFDETLWQALLERYARFRRTPTANNRSQAEIPEGAIVLPNRWGSAPGLWLEGTAGLVIMLPGVPVEMRNLLQHEVMPRITRRGGSVASVIRSGTVRTTGIAESALAERLGDIETRLAPLTLAYLPGVASVDLRVTAWDLPPHEADARLEAALGLLEAGAGEFAYGRGDADLAAVLLAEARRRGCRIGVAESCTGGLVGGRITAVPGSSDVFVGGIVAYSNEVKREVLGVGATTIEAHGAVSEPVAVEMAHGAAARLGADMTMAVTGIAGPDGGTADKPVGLVCFGFHVRGREDSLQRVLFGDREEIRARATQLALFEALRRLRSLPD